MTAGMKAAFELPTEQLSIKAELDALVLKYEKPAFIESDPVSVAHGFDDPADQEIIGLYAALLAWGQRKTILAKLEDLCERMDYRPYRFVRDFADRRAAVELEGFVHRTFQPIDAFWMTRLLSLALRRYGSLNAMFSSFSTPEADVGPVIDGFSKSLLQLHPDTPNRLRKHLARPSAGSSCKRLAMYLRWMVRTGPVDLGIWTGIAKSQLVLPLDVHSRRAAECVGALTRKSNDWLAVQEMTNFARRLCPEDPARYDFAFYGPGSSGDVVGTASRISPTAR